ncbi:MAG: hypothetical protein Q8S92_09880 [Hydrogenophaga sp.]|nr:hypothetical protein [Hydrogenophaga sp.]MDP3107941.1 hypothetical protein [Hydrogenophaga sp.]MDP3349293.1 hypothetical protein [Hydrogenophaga sp.]
MDIVLNDERTFPLGVFIAERLAIHVQGFNADGACMRGRSIEHGVRF